MSDQLSSDLHSLRINRRQAPPPAKSRRVLWIVLAVIILSALLISSVAPAISRAIFKTPVETTEVILASPSRATVQLTASGYVVPQRTSKVGAKITGRISKIHVKEGDHVKEGNLMAELEDAQERSAVLVSLARASSSEARLRTAEAQLLEAEQQLERQRQLAMEGVAAQATIEDLQARRDSLLAARDAARSEAEATRAEVQAYRTNLSYMRVLAPMSGVVIGKPAGEGQLVGVMASDIAEIADLDSLMIEVDVPERRLTQVTIGNPCEAVLDAFPNRRLRCRVHEISQRVDRAKATVTVKVAFADSTEGVLPDMSARVGFLSQEVSEETLNKPDELLVPKSAVTGGSGQEAVYVIRDGKAHREVIRYDEVRGDYYRIVQGPIAGTQIINNPPPGLADGHPVKEIQP